MSIESDWPEIINLVNSNFIFQLGFPPLIDTQSKIIGIPKPLKLTRAALTSRVSNQVWQVDQDITVELHSKLQLFKSSVELHTILGLVKSSEP